MTTYTYNALDFVTSINHNEEKQVTWQSLTQLKEFDWDDGVEEVETEDRYTYDATNRMVWGSEDEDHDKDDENDANHENPDSVYYTHMYYQYLQWNINRHGKAVTQNWVAVFLYIHRRTNNKILPLTSFALTKLKRFNKT